MNWELFVSTRYLFARQKERFISLTSLISILGIVVGVAALIVVIGVMTGFDEELQNKIVGMNAHLVVVSDSAERAMPAIPLDGVEAAAEFVSGQAIASNDKESLGVLLKGIDPASERRVTCIGEYLKSGDLPAGDGSVIIGSELAKRFIIGIGDTVSFLSFAAKKPVTLTVCGIFTSGMYEYDSNMAITNIRTARQILGNAETVSGIAIKLREPMKAEVINHDLQRALGYPFWVRSWVDLNRNLFSALKLEKIVMFIILALIILVACFNIASTLIMTVIEKTRDIGILKAIGAPDASIMKIFVFEGLLIGLLGAGIGGVLGLWLGRALGTYPIIQKLGLQEIYYFDRLPVTIQTSDFVMVISVAVLISLLATAYPAFKAARLDPVEAIRYE